MGRGRGKARGHGVTLTTGAVPAGDQLAAFLIAGLGGVAHAVRGVAVHHHPAGGDRHVVLVGRTEQRFTGDLVRGAEHQRRGGAVRQQQVEEDLGLLGRPVRVSKARFGWEGVSFQPLQQLGAVTGHHRQLRHVYVGVDHAGQDQPLRRMLDRCARRQSRQQFGGVTDRLNSAIGNHQQAVGEVAVTGRIGRAEPRLGQKVQQWAAEGRHAAGIRVGRHPSSPGRSNSPTD